MHFISIDFAIFLPIVFILYWFVVGKNLALQNALIVAASYVFYGWWNWRFLSLIVFCTLMDYGIGVALQQQQNIKARKLLLTLSIVVNLGFLAFFKYSNFFIDSFVTAFTFFGATMSADSLHIKLLPIVGISFYTFQSLSYTIDVYRKQLTATRNPITFAAFVSFFPQLVAGPIERATHLLPQFYVKRQFDYTAATDGMRQILWGLFTKIVIADNCAIYANQIFNNSAQYSGSTLLLGAFFFSFQIYGDFSAYSHIAIGTARLFGFSLMRNFNTPYFSRSMVEFWRRWHISLSTWFRDYVYIPLGGNRGTKAKHIRNICIVFLLSGLWHGADYTFIAWGTLHALFIIPFVWWASKQKSDAANTPANISHLGSILLTFTLTTLAWVFFRASSMPHALQYFSEIFSSSLFTIPQFEGRGAAMLTLLLVALFVAAEWHTRHQPHALAAAGTHWWRPVRWSLYYILILSLLYFGASPQQFIYFQF
ncbi:MAG: MBOAT family O-acyltransferase [Bacteroidota bacterium]